MALPLRLLKDLQVTRQQKIALAAVFTLGLLIVATAVVRMTQILGQARTDPVGLAVWGLVESSVAVIVGSLPPLKSFLAKKLARYGTGGYVYGGNANYLPGSKGARGTPGSHLHTDKSAGGKTSSIPLEDRDGSDNSVSRLKDGQIVVTKSYGWERTESVGEHESVNMHGPDDEERGLVGMAVSPDDLRSRHHSTRIENKDVVEGKTWLRTSMT